MADQWTEATPLDNWVYQTEDFHYENPIGEMTLSSDPVNNPPPGMIGYGQTWHTLFADSTRILDLFAQTVNQGDTVVMALWSLIDGTWGVIVPPTPPAYGYTIGAEVEGGVQYYVMFASGSAANTTPGIRWSADLIPLPPPAEQAPPIRVVVSIHDNLSAPTIDAPPLKVQLGAFGEPSLPVVLFPGSMTLSAPEAGAALPTTKPQFIVAVTSDDPNALYTVVIEYADNQAMDNPVEMSGTTDALNGGVILVPTDPVPEVTYWRARLLLGTVVCLDWSAVQGFTVIAVVESVALPVTWTVDTTAAPLIHMWHFDPSGPLDGDTVTIYGQGFPASGTLSYGELVLPTTSWQLVAVSDANADDSTRTISGDTVTPEHYEVQFVAPEDDGPGDALVLEG